MHNIKFDAYTFKITLKFRVGKTNLIGLQICRMRIKSLRHTLDTRVNHGLTINFVNIQGRNHAHHLKHFFLLTKNRTRSICTDHITNPDPKK